MWSLKRSKYTVPIPEVTSNVRIEDFVPQAVVLAHHNVRVFLSHCGMNSFLEAMNSGVPILALPFIADQVHNAHTVVTNHAGLKLDASNITVEHVVHSIHRLINEPSYVAPSVGVCVSTALHEPDATVWLIAASPPT